MTDGQPDSNFRRQSSVARRVPKYERTTDEQDGVGIGRFVCFCGAINAASRRRCTKRTLRRRPLRRTANWSRRITAAELGCRRRAGTDATPSNDSAPMNDTRRPSPLRADGRPVDSAADSRGRRRAAAGSRRQPSRVNGGAPSSSVLADTAVRAASDSADIGGVARVASSVPNA